MRLLVDRRAASPGNGCAAAARGAIVGASAIVEGSLSDRLRPGPFHGSLRRPQLGEQGLQLGPQRSPAPIGNFAQIVLQARLAARPPVGLELPADRVDAPYEIDIQFLEVGIRFVAHLYPLPRACRNRHVPTPKRPVSPRRTRRLRDMSLRTEIVTCFTSIPPPGCGE